MQELKVFSNTQIPIVVPTQPIAEATLPFVDQHASNTVDADAVEDPLHDSHAEANSHGESHDVPMNNLPNIGVGKTSHTYSGDFVEEEAGTSSALENPSILRKSKRQCVQPI